MTQPANHDPITRARQLAADYQANPTPARAHNAAQALQRVLDALDAVVARTSRIAALAAQLDMPHLAELPTDAANRWTAVDQAQTSQLAVTASTYATGGIVDTTTVASIGENS